MTLPDEPDGLDDALRATIRVIADFDGRGVIIGGVAVSLLSEPRFTNDLDAVVLMDLDELPLLLERAAAHGLVPRIENPIEFARQSRVVLLRHERKDMAVDISLGVLPFEEEVVQRARTQETVAGPVPLPTVEDLIILKAVAHRPKDMQDIAALRRAHPNLDQPRIEAWVTAFAEILDLPELWDDVAPILEAA